MQITASLVKELRERTGAGMMECKKALVEAAGDIDLAAENMRKTGLAKADKKAGRVAAEGLIGLAIADDGKAAALVEVNCETDFVAKQDEFAAFANAVAAAALAAGADDVDALGAAAPDGGASVEDRRRELIARIGENITVRRVARVAAAGRVGSYVHGGRIGVLVDVAGGGDDVAKDVAMHIAASRPVCVGEDDIPAEMLAKEREILLAQVAESGKPPEIQEKMVSGRLRKFTGEITLLGQPFVKDPDLTVGKFLDKAGAKVAGFWRLEVGEGIEKKSENFAEEVMAQVRGA